MWQSIWKGLGPVGLGLICALGFAHAGETGPAAPASNADLETIKKRIQEFCIGSSGADAALQKKVEEYMRSLQKDGRWKSVTYSDSSRSSWKAVGHLGRLRQMAVVYRTPENPLYQKAELKTAILSALDFWLAKDFKNSNWWWNTIGVPRQLYVIMILMDEGLNEKQRAKGFEILTRAKIGMTGQNLVWVADISLARGVLQKNVALTRKAIGAIANTIRASSGEGLQTDNSFYQHGLLLYAGGYGRGFSIDCARVASFVQGTSLAFPKNKIDLLSNYILEGQQWMIRGETFDYGAVGRELARKGHSARGLIQACESMAKLGTPRQKEFEAFAARIRKGAVPEGDLVGNRHFWRSDFMVHHRAKFYASVRMHSNRVRNTDGPANSEGLLSHHVSDGVTYVFRDGKEYFDIFGAWDWRKLPGATIRQKGAKSITRSGTTSFVGGVSDGRFGTAGFDFEREGLIARKSWFFFDDEFVCLGANLSCSGSEPVLTTLNQSLLRGAVAYSDGQTEKVLESGTHDLMKTHWVHHDQVGYLFFSPQRATVKIAAQDISWRRINKKYPAHEGKLDVFSLWIDHGAAPKKASYQYLVVPGKTREQMASYVAQVPIKILKNSATLQAVTHTGLNVTGFVFYQPGKIEMADHLQISVDQACMVQMQWANGKALFALAKPPGGKGAKSPLVNLEINRKLEGEGCSWNGKTGATRIVFNLPVKLFAGKSVVVEALESKQ